MQKKLVALTLAALVACGVAGCGGDKKPAKAAEPAKQTASAKKDDKQQTVTDEKKKAAENHAREVMKLPEVAKYKKISEEAFPHLKWGSTGFNYLDNNKLGKDRKNALLDYGEVEAHFIRNLAKDDRPKFKDKNGKDVEGDERYKIEVLVGGCKGNCVIEAVGTHTKSTDAASYDKPVVETKVYVPFDKTYVRHNENGKKWVTHEKCGTK